MSNRVEKWKIPFFTIWTGQMLSLVGSSVAQFALVWWVTKLTGSATVLATATMMAILPGVFLGPLVGAYVDRASRKWIMVAADGLVALAALVLAYLFWSGQLQVWHVYVVMFVRAIGGSFHWPAMQASTSLMVPQQHLSRVAGLNQAANGLMSIAGPPLGALLMSVMPLHSIMLIDVGTALGAIVLLLPVAIPQPEPAKREAREARPSIWVDAAQGLRYVWSWPGLTILMVAAMLINLIWSPATSLLPLLVTTHFKGEALHLAWLEAGWGVGVVAGGLVLGVWGGFKRRIYTTLVGVMLMGSGMGVLGVVPADMFWLALLSFGFAGFMSPITNGPLFAVLQATVAPEYQGRVFTVINSLASAMMPVGLALAGPLSDWLGLRVWYLVGAAACVLMGLICMSIPAVTNIEQNHRGHPVSGAGLVPVPVEVSADAREVL